MKKIILTISAVVIAAIATKVSAQDANVALSNLNTNSWYDSYNDATKTINDLNFEVLSDGNNSMNVIPDFVVKVYVYDPNTQNHTFVKSYTVSGMNQMSSIDYTNQNIDLSSLSWPAGTYRIGVDVDANDDIPNPPDDPSDNIYLLDGSFNFTPASPSGIAKITTNKINLNCFPNPATNQLHIEWNNNQSSVTSINITDLTGKIVKNVNVFSGETNLNIPISNLANGLYILSAYTKTGVTHKKFLKQ